MRLITTRRKLESYCVAGAKLLSHQRKHIGPELDSDLVSLEHGYYDDISTYSISNIVVVVELVEMWKTAVIPLCVALARYNSPVCCGPLSTGPVEDAVW